jgi:hypothetical protein
MTAADDGLGRRALRVLRVAYLPLALAFVFAAGWGAREVVLDLLARMSWAALAATVALYALLHLLSPAFAHFALRAAGTAIPYRRALAIHVSRLPARYLPGGIWHTVSRVADLRAAGVAPRTLATLVALENSVPVAVAVIGGVAALGASASRPWIALAAAAIAGLIALPWLLERRWVLAVRLDRRHYAACVALMLGFWSLAALAFLVYFRAFPDASSAPALHVVSAYLLAWASGFVAVFAPQGVGVFEAMVGSMLGGALSFAALVSLALGFRLVVLVADLACWSALLLLRARRR